MKMNINRFTTKRNVLSHANATHETEKPLPIYHQQQTAKSFFPIAKANEN